LVQHELWKLTDNPVLLINFRGTKKNRTTVYYQEHNSSRFEKMRYYAEMQNLFHILRIFKALSLQKINFYLKTYSC